MTRLLVDTDIFVDHLRGARPLVTDGNRLAYSVVTRCELFAGSHVDEETLRRLLATFTELPVDRRIAERAGRLRRETATKIADALIAATALEHELTLLTRNLRHFANVPGLRVRSDGSGRP